VRSLDMFARSAYGNVLSMAAPDDPSEDGENSFHDRVEAVRAFVDAWTEIMVPGDLEWKEVEKDFRLLAINSCIRRQMESLRAALILSEQDLGHLAVSFVRASLEDVTYLQFFVSLPREEAQELFIVFGTWDGFRSLLAQREYVGDDAMNALWYSKDFLANASKSRDKIRNQLKMLQKKYRWSGGLLPSADWIADQAGYRPLYNYLHAATSRSLHFSAGEILRRGWGDPNGRMITDKPEFREHLASFALDQLVRLLVQTTLAIMPLMETAGIASRSDVAWEDVQPALDRAMSLGQVPLVHAYEWNLTPEGPRRFTGGPATGS
jgi:hypothetical protein